MGISVVGCGGHYCVRTEPATCRFGYLYVLLWAPLLRVGSWCQCWTDMYWHARWYRDEFVSTWTMGGAARFSAPRVGIPLLNFEAIAV